MLTIQKKKKKSIYGRCGMVDVRKGFGEMYGSLKLPWKIKIEGCIWFKVNKSVYKDGQKKWLWISPLERELVNFEPHPYLCAFWMSLTVDGKDKWAPIFVFLVKFSNRLLFTILLDILRSIFVCVWSIDSLLLLSYELQFESDLMKDYLNHMPCILISTIISFSWWVL